MKVYKKAILPAGFTANGFAAGIKASGKLDLALFYSSSPARASVQTSLNKIQAAPLKINKEHLKVNKYFQAVIVNSGNANCFTGAAGLSDARKMAAYAAGGLGLKKEEVLVASTGIIGRRLPVSKIKKAAPLLIAGLSAYGINRAKLAILTTDRVTKEITVKFNIGSKTVTICGVAKGSGMIAPNMATMLSFIMTDAAITGRALDKALKFAVERSFNCISVDNCMSTNDTVILLDNKLAGNTVIDTGSNFGLFSSALNMVCLELAKMIVKDAEGATKFIRIRVSRAKTYAQARKIALSIAGSNLFKTAIYAKSQNFYGRAAAAAGSSGMDVGENGLKITASDLNKKEINIEVRVNRGNASAQVYTCDLTHEYIRINAEYN
ncbi:MAG: bifunctional glutamate N-acetyltransferase/amino-acid acetyltransferase ArgJ [Deltaproteobacteria bacterium]